MGFSSGILARLLPGLFRSGAIVAGDVQQLVVGIGNPGPEYRCTRHNIGFMAADALSAELQTRKRASVEQSTVTWGLLEPGLRVAAAKPQTYVNQSGSAFGALVRRLGLPLDSCLVVVDDFHLPLGAIRFRRSGSDGGHNGLKSIIAEVGRDFPRMRIGIGPVSGESSIIDFVLGEFGAEEKDILKEKLPVVRKALRTFCLKGIERAMTAFNS